MKESLGTWVPYGFEWIFVVGIGLLVVAIIWAPSRKAIGLLLIILGIIECLTCALAILGIPSIIIGGIFFFIGRPPSPKIVIQSQVSPQKPERMEQISHPPIDLSKMDPNLTVICPTCKDKQRVPVEYKGRPVKCQLCGTRFTVIKETLAT